jgi:hypothetical protein
VVFGEELVGEWNSVVSLGWNEMLFLWVSEEVWGWSVFDICNIGRADWGISVHGWSRG